MAREVHGESCLNSRGPMLRVLLSTAGLPIVYVGSVAYLLVLGKVIGYRLDPIRPHSEEESVRTAAALGRARSPDSGGSTRSSHRRGDGGAAPRQKKRGATKARRMSA